MSVEPIVGNGPGVAAPSTDGPKKPTRRRMVADRAMYALAWLAGITDVSFAEAQRQAYDAKDDPRLNRAILAPHAEFLFKLQRENSSHTDDKTKQLLALSSSLTAVLLAFARDVQPKLIVVSILGLLVCSVFLCLSVLSVRTDYEPEPVDTQEVYNGPEWARNLIAAINGNSAAHQFRVDRYRAAGRYFRLALLLTPIAGFFTAKRVDQAAELKTAVDSLTHHVDRVAWSIDSMRLRGVSVRSTGAVLILPDSNAQWRVLSVPSKKN